MLFSPATIEAIGSYVYALTDENERIFYIGKGTGNRVFQHVDEVRRLIRVDPSIPWESEADDADVESTSLKQQAIAQMLVSGREPGMYILRESLTQDQALMIEAVLISVFDWQYATLNVIGGHGTAHFGLKSVVELEATKGEGFKISDLPDLGGADEILAININRRWPEVVSGVKSLFEVSRGVWKLNKDRARRCPYVVVHSNGIVRGVFKVESWHGPDSEGRHSFVAVGAQPLEGPAFRQKNVSNLFPSDVRRSQSPVRYIQCPR